jgi:outer membrane receptor protein involved in Fe transport
LSLAAPDADWWRNLRWNTIGSFAQFDWELHPRLTLNLGLRHDMYTVPKERDGKTANLRNWETDTALTFGDPWWNNPSYKNFSPRIGMAYDPTGSGKTAIRAGFGTFYNLIQPEMFRMFPYRTPPAKEIVTQQTEGVIPFPAGFYDYATHLTGSSQIFVFPYENAGNARWCSGT